MPQIARLKIVLDEVEPAVMRRLDVPLDIRLDHLHLVIQAAMPWENYHLYEFSTDDGPGWGIPDPDLDGPDPQFRPAAEATLAHLLESAGGKTFTYAYDFGDGWLHVVKVEQIAEAEPGAAYPRLLAAHGACPPEDCGGPFGYARYLEAIADPEHEDHDDMIAWRGPGFDPDHVDEQGIAKDLAALAKALGSGRGRRRAAASRRR